MDLKVLCLGIVLAVSSFGSSLGGVGTGKAASIRIYLLWQIVCGCS